VIQQVPLTAAEPRPSSLSREVVRRLGKWSTALVGCGLSRLFGSVARGRVGILTYHRIATAAGTPTWNVTPARFRAQLKGLLRKGYQPIALRKLLGPGPLPPRAFVVTFDDGYENVHTHAWPVLRDLGVPATIFLATAYLDHVGPFPFDDWLAAGSDQVPRAAWRPLTTAQCTEMAAGGLIDLGSHTHTHAAFRGRTETFREDLAASLAVLRQRFEVAAPLFAFPFGIADPDLVAAVRQSGAVCSLTTQEELVQPGSDPFTWGRLHADEADTAASLAVKLDGWYSIARNLWLRWTGARRGLVAGREAPS